MPGIPTKKEASAGLQLALDLVEENAGPAWNEEALAVIERLCRERDVFMCDDVWDAGLRPAHNDKALGPVLLRAKKLGLCEKTGRMCAARRSHMSARPEWRSLLRPVKSYEPPTRFLSD